MTAQTIDPTYLRILQGFHRALTLAGQRNVFVTNPSMPLQDVLMSSLPSDLANLRNKREESRFFKRDATLVTILPDNSLKSLVWDETLIPDDSPYKPTVATLRKAVEHPLTTVIRPHAWAPLTKEENELNAAIQIAADELLVSSSSSAPSNTTSALQPFAWSFTPLSSHCASPGGQSARSSLLALEKLHRELSLSVVHYAPRVVAEATELLETHTELPGALAMIEGAKFFKDAQIRAISAAVGAIHEEQDAQQREELCQEHLHLESVKRSLWRSVVLSPPNWAAPRWKPFGSVCMMVGNGNSFGQIWQCLEVIFKVKPVMKPMMTNDE